MKKSVKLIITVAIMLLILCNTNCYDVYASNATVSFGSSYYSKSQGEEFPIGVYVKSDLGVGIHAIRIKYDNTKLQYISGATKEANGVILLKGNGGQTSVKYWLLFKAISGGKSNMVVDVAKVYVNNNTQLINISTLPTAPISVEGKDLAGAMSDLMKSDSNNSDSQQENNTSGRITATNDANTSSNEIDDDNILNDDSEDVMHAADVNSNTQEETDEGDLNQINDTEDYDSESEVVSSEDLGVEENEDEVKDNKKDSGNFIVSVLVNLVIFVGLTAIGIALINAIFNKGKKNRRLEQEFEEEYKQDYASKYRTNNNVAGNGYAGDEHMRPIPFDEFEDRQFNREDSAVRYDPRYSPSQNQIDVEFVCHNSPIERYDGVGYSQQSYGEMNVRPGEFDYIEQNLERSLEEQIKQQIDNNNYY